MNFFDWLKQNNCHITFTKSNNNYIHIELHGPVKLFNKNQNVYYNPRSWGVNKINSIKNLINIIYNHQLFFVTKQEKTVIFFKRIVEVGNEIFVPRLKLPDLSEETKKLAKQKWESAGCPAGLDEKFWFAAENELIDKLTEN